MGLNCTYKWTHEVQTLAVQESTFSICDWEFTDMKGRLHSSFCGVKSYTRIFYCAPLISALFKGQLYCHHLIIKLWTLRFRVIRNKSKFADIASAKARTPAGSVQFYLAPERLLGFVLLVSWPAALGLFSFKWGQWQIKKDPKVNSWRLHYIPTRSGIGGFRHLALTSPQPWPLGILMTISLSLSWCRFLEDRSVLFLLHLSHLTCAWHKGCA